MSAVISRDGPVNTSPHTAESSMVWVSEIQAKLHRWASTNPGRRFDDLFNLVHHPATLAVAWERVASNRGARSAGSDGWTAASVQEQVGVTQFLHTLRADLKDGSYRPEPVRERTIPKPGGSGKVRSLGIPTVRDRVVQGALKLVLEPIFEADFQPVSYGFRPERRAHDAIAEIHMFGTKGYRWVLDADIEACFDRIDHTALMGRVRNRVGDKRVLRLAKAFLKAGILTELGTFEDTHTGTPQGGILSPLLANIALSVLDEDLHAPWKLPGEMSTAMRRVRRRWKSLPNWRIVRYADDFVILTDGNERHLEALRDHITEILRPMGLNLSAEKTRTVHMSEGFEFLGFHIQWKQKKGTQNWYVYTFPADRTIRSVKDKIRALTPRTSHHDLEATLTRINQIIRGWANYFRHAVVTHVFNRVHQYTWWRVVRWQRTLHRWRWKDVRKWLVGAHGHWRLPYAGEVELFNPLTIPVKRYRYRGGKIPSPFAPTPVV